MDAVEIAKKRSFPGFMIFDQLKRPIYWSPAAAEILQMGEDSSNIPVKASRASIPGEIVGLVDRLRSVSPRPLGKEELPHSYPATIISEKQKTYHCRAFYLHGRGAPEKNADQHVMVLFEELTPRNLINKEKLKETYYFTDRHLDILTHLVNGATNQEIGSRLKISEDTVKAHLKNIMKRMGVNTRSSVLSKVLELS